MSQPGASVPQWLVGGAVVGIIVPAAPIRRYQAGVIELSQGERMLVFETLRDASVTVM